MLRKLGLALLVLCTTATIPSISLASTITPIQTTTSIDYHIVLAHSDGSFHNGLLFAEQSDGTRVYYNTQGNEAFILSPELEPLSDFWDQRAMVRNRTTKLIGYINTKGVLVIPCKYSEGSSFSKGVAYVAEGKSNESAFIDKAGNLLNSLTKTYDSEYNFSDGLALTYESKTGKVGFINKSGELVIPYEHAYARGFSNGLALVQNSKGNYGYIDKTGKIVIPFQYKSGGDYEEGLMAVQNSKGKWGYINRMGKTIIPFKYENANQFSEGLAIVYNSSGKIGFIDKKGKMVIDYQKYTRAFDFSNGIALVGIGTHSDPSSKFGYIDRQGRLLTKLEYRVESSSFRDGYAVAIKTEGKGVILSKGFLVH